MEVPSDGGGGVGMTWYSQGLSGMAAGRARAARRRGGVWLDSGCVVKT